MKLKINKTFTKRLRPKIRNQKKRDWSWTTSNQNDQIVIFRKKRKKRKKEKERFIVDKLDHHQRHVLH